jgi:N-acetylmuramoyl-L-alanine amidase
MKVCIDPGHGMSNRQGGVFDPGATHVENGFLFTEADFVLRYGLALKDEFRANGVGVFMTRDDSTDHAPVSKRASGAKAAGCDIFVSLHMNDAEVDQANGLEVLYRGDDDKPLAELLVKALVEVTGLRNRGIKQRLDLAVLKFQGVAVLIELGFIGNDGDRERLLQPQTREAVTRTIASVVTNQLAA